MKVRCIKILDPMAVPPFNRETSEHPGVSVGREYVVAFIMAFPGRTPELGILDDRDGGMSRWPVEMFATTSMRVPSNWVAEIDTDGALTIAPRAWLRPQFWHDLHGDQDASHEVQLEAARELREELEVITRESE